MPKKHGLTSGWIKAAALAAVMAGVAAPAYSQSGKQTPLTTGALPMGMGIETVRGGDSRPPIGWVEFCAKRQYAAECAVDPPSRTRSS